MSNAKLNLRGVHVFEKVPGQSLFRLRETHTAMRFGNEQQALFIQDGLVFEEGGKQVAWEDIPGWLLTAIEHANPVTLREAGWKGVPGKGK